MESAQAYRLGSGLNYRFEHFSGANRNSIQRSNEIDVWANEKDVVNDKKKRITTSLIARRDTVDSIRATF